MCGGVRGVGGGGIVSTAYCLLYKLYTLKLTRKQVGGLIVHKDSPYIRALGFMYVRYTQNPGDLWSWYADYLDDEEVNVKFLLNLPVFIISFSFIDENGVYLLSFDRKTSKSIRHRVLKNICCLF